MLLDLPSPDLQAYHDYHARLQQQQQQQQEKVVPQSLDKGLDKDKGKGRVWWWWGGTRSKQRIRPELNIFWHDNGHSDTHSDRGGEEKEEGVGKGRTEYLQKSMYGEGLWPEEGKQEEEEEEDVWGDQEGVAGGGAGPGRLIL